MAIDEWSPPATVMTELGSGPRGLRTYLRLFRRRWLLVLMTILGTVGAIVLAAILWDAPYEARATLQVPATWTGSLENVLLDVDYTERLLNTYVALSESGQLNREVAERLNLSDDELETELEIPANTELLVAKATASTPEIAASGANELATLLATEIRNDLAGRYRTAGASLERQIGELDERVTELGSTGSPDRLSSELITQRELLQNDFNRLRALREAAARGVSVVESAEPPSNRSDVVWLLALALVVGLSGALVFVIVVDRLDETVFDVGLLTTQLGYRVLGEVTSSAHDPDDPASVGSVDVDPRALHLAYRLKSDVPRTLMVTSVRSGRRPTEQVAQLCIALASTGVSVLVVDTAVSPVELAPLLGVDPKVGGADAELTSSSVNATAPTSYENLFIAAARWAPQFMTLPYSIVRALDQLREGFDMVVVYVPALNDRAEASLLGKVVEQSILVVGEGAVTDEDLRQALRQMEAMPSEFLGAVVATADERRRRTRVH